jgi:hypothetical protein
MGNSFVHLKSESNNVKEDYYEKAKILFHFVCLNVQLIYDGRRRCS